MSEKDEVDEVEISRQNGNAFVQKVKL